MTHASQQDYVKVANILAAAHVWVDGEAQFPYLSREAGHILLDHITADLAEMFQEDNPKFNRARFLRAARSV